VVNRLVLVLLVMFAFEVYSEDEKEVVVRCWSVNISNRLLSGTKRVENTMNTKQKYLFDLTGYLHLKNVLETDELSNVQAAW